MEIRILTGCSGPAGSFMAGERIEAPDAVAVDLIRAGYAEAIEAGALIPDTGLHGADTHAVDADTDASQPVPIPGASDRDADAA